MNPIGITAGLATAFSWAACAIFFTSASRRIGVFSMNNWRVLFGFILLASAHMMIFGRPFPQAGANEFWLLVSSGIIGVVIGDTFLFQSYVDIGPRLGLLIFNVNPFLAALLAWPVLGEKLKWTAWIAMAITVSGCLWVLNEENKNQKEIKSPHYARGILFAFLAAAGQAGGYVIAKPAIMGPYGLDPLSATLIRVGSAVAGYWLISLLKGDARHVLSKFKDTRAMLYLAAGAMTGPFIGIWLSLTALKYIPAGIAATLISTMPVVILPMVWLIYKEKITWRAAIGAAVTVAGVALLVNV
jgi:drug/metabolite transporter (DMT)-like permease